MKIINSDDVDFKTNATISQEIRGEDGKELVTWVMIMEYWKPNVE